MPSITYIAQHLSAFYFLPNRYYEFCHVCIARFKTVAMIDEDNIPIGSATIGVRHDAITHECEEVLVEGFSKDPRRLTGRTRSHKHMHFTGDAATIGEIVKVRVTEAHEMYLVGVAE